MKFNRFSKIDSGLICVIVLMCNLCYIFFIFFFAKMVMLLIFGPCPAEAKSDNFFRISQQVPLIFAKTCRFFE
jgi:hypothetical protein